MNLKTFCDQNKDRKDDVGKVCRAALNDSIIQWNWPLYEQMRRITEFQKKFGYRTIDLFFKEFKENRNVSV